MSTLDLYRNALASCVAAALLAGCGGSQPPIGAPGAMMQSRAIARHAASGGSWMLREASGENLLYISAIGSGDIYVYSYPQGKRVGTLTGLYNPIGECVDAAGDVFIVTQGSRSSDASLAYEYAHAGTSPIAVLNDPGYAIGCAVDPTTGNLAVANIDDVSNPYYHDAGDVAIYASAQGTPTMYYSALYTAFSFCGYDNQGNLYLSAQEKSVSSIELARISNGSQSIDPINLSAQIYAGYEFSPTVQWDGRNMTISSVPRVEGHKGSGVVTVYRLDISGSNARVIGKAKLESKANRHRGQSWIQNDNIIGLDDDKGYEYVSSWAYPKGGKPSGTIAKIPPGAGVLWGLDVSLAQTR